jgi:hypothetical protein
VDLPAGNYGYILKINETIISQGRVIVDASKHAVFTSSVDTRKTWNADITDSGIRVTSPIPYDDGSGSVTLGSFEPDKAALENPPSLDGEWCNPYRERPVYSFSGDNYVHKTVSGTRSTGTFSLSNSTISFNPSYGEYSNFQTPWSQSYKMIGNVFYIDYDGRHNFGPFLRLSESSTGIEGVWRNSGEKHRSLTFVKNLFNITSDDGFLESGAFNLDDPGYITLEHWTGDKKIPYSLSGNTLTVTGTTHDRISAGAYEKITLQGAWRNPYEIHPVFTFSGSNVTLTSDDSSRDWSGTFTADGSKITFTQPSSSPATWSQNYVFYVDGYVHDGKNVVLGIESDNQHFWGPYYRTTP